MRVVPWLILISTMVGCAKHRDPAPEDLDGLLHYVFRNFEDPDLLADAVDNLGLWLEANAHTDEAAEGYRVDPLTGDDTPGIDRPDLDLVDAMGVAAAGVSPFRITPHAEAIVLDDQVYTDPPSYDQFERNIMEGDAGGFVVCDSLVRTDNDVVKSKVGVTIPYLLHKDFRWVHIDDDRAGIVARSWVTEQSCNNNGNNCINQSYGIDVWYTDGGPDTLRVMTSWNDVTTSVDGLLTEDAKVAVAVNGILSIFDYTDAFLEHEDY